jgi:hypothetical protein
MGLKDILAIQGSKFTYTAEGGIPITYPINYVITPNVLATIESNLHYDRELNTKGWSTKGYLFPNSSKTIQNYNLYKDGDPSNFLPFPSDLELNQTSYYITQTFK